MEHHGDYEIIPKTDTAKRYKVHPVTIDRWVANPEIKFPPPIVINRRKYFRLDQLQEYDRANAEQAL